MIYYFFSLTVGTESGVQREKQGHTGMDVNVFVVTKSDGQSRNDMVACRTRPF